MLQEIKEQIPTIKEKVINATSAYIRYYQDNKDDWDDYETKIVEETVGVLVLGGQKLNEFIEHFSAHETLPEGIPTETELHKFVTYFETISNTLLKQIPVQYQK